MALAQAFAGVLAQNQPIPTGVDGGRLALVMLKGGTTYEQLRAMAGAAAQDFNEEMMTVWGDLFYPTQKIEVMYPNGGTLPKITATSGGARPQLIRGEISGHMIDRQVYPYGIGGDWRALADMTADYILASVRAGNQMLRNLWDQTLLTRFFSNAENLLGTNGYDVGFCDGSPSTLQYAPPQWNGQVFTASHNHYLSFNSSTTNPDTGVAYTYGDMLSGLAKTINEHGLAGDYKAYVSELDVATILNLTNYIKPVENISIIDRGGATTGNQFFEKGSFGATPNSGGRYIGTYNSGYGNIRLFATYRVPQGYAGVYCPGDQGNLTNALAVNYRPEFGLGVKILEVPDWNTTFPLKEIDLELEFGVSCGASRYAGAAGEFGAGVTVYAVPAIN